MTNSKKQDKTLSQNQTLKTQNNNTDTNTNVYIRFDEPKITVSFRCNRELWFGFKKQIRAQGLSICHVLEPMIFGWLNGYVNISNTIKPLKIENLVVERAVKRVRRYAVEPEFGDGKCHFCGRDAVGLFEYLRTRERYPLCSFHAREFVDGKVWGVVRE
ncbi:MAG: hypothetical protein ACPLYF_05355 [Fervidobacterium sp.]